MGTLNRGHRAKSPSPGIHLTQRDRGEGKVKVRKGGGEQLGREYITIEFQANLSRCSKRSKLRGYFSVF